MRELLLVPLVLLALVAVAFAEADQFLTRDGNVSPAQTYLDSDGGVMADEPSDSDWETFVDGKPPPPDRFELPGLFAIKQTAPELQTLVAGPTFRNQKNRIEVGAGLAYINSKTRLPFEFSVEPTYRRNKRVSSGQRDFARIRTFGLVDLWGRSSSWESTSVAVTGFYDWQENSFNNLELGGAVTQVIGRRLAVSANLAWGGDWPNGGEFSNAAFGSVGASYNLGAGLRTGGFFEPDNNYTHENDFGGFISYQFLPFAELVVNVAKHEFVGVRLMISYALERP